MAINGETGHCYSTCTDCKQELLPQVLKSAAGYYVGTFCHCGPYSRETGYFRTKEEVADVLPLFLKKDLYDMG